MNLNPSPPRGPDCPPAVELEALAIEGTSAHLAGCASCREHVDSLRREITDFVKRQPFELFEAKLQRRRHQPTLSRLRLILPWVVAALLAVVWVANRPPENVLPKGSENPFRVFVRRGNGQVFPVTVADAIKAGDTLKFSFEAPREGHLLLFDLDGRERATVAYPFEGTHSVSIPAGAQILDGSVEVDDAPGPEWLVAVFSPQPFDAATLAAQLKGQSSRSELQLKCQQCRWYALRLKKE